MKLPAEEAASYTVAIKARDEFVRKTTNQAQSVAGLPAGWLVIVPSASAKS